MANAKPYPLMIDTRVDSSAEAMIKDLAQGQDRRRRPVGPMAGYYAKKANPPLHVTPLVKETTGPEAGLSHRHGRARRGPELEAAAQPPDPGEPAAINKILLDFGVPLLDENDRPIGAETATKSP